MHRKPHLPCRIPSPSHPTHFSTSPQLHPRSSHRTNTRSITIHPELALFSDDSREPLGGGGGGGTKQAWGREGAHSRPNSVNWKNLLAWRRLSWTTMDAMVVEEWTHRLCALVVWNLLRSDEGFS